MSTASRAEDPAAAASALPVVRSVAVEWDVDARIREAEARLVAREQDLRRRWGHLTSRVQHAVSPRRLAWPLLGAALAGFALWSVWRGRTPARGVAQAGADAPRSRAAPVDWLTMPLLGLVWPLLPVSWRSRISPGMAQSFVAMGLPLLQGLFVRHHVNPPATMERVDLGRYAGNWYEIARLPVSGEGARSGQPSAHYSLRDDGMLDVVHRCSGQDGRQRRASGLARAVAGGGGARLEVSLWPAALRWLPLAWDDVWILHVDEDYSQALIGSPGRRRLWILSREPTLPRERLLPLLRAAQERGYAVERLEFAQPL